MLVKKLDDLAGDIGRFGTAAAGVVLAVNVAWFAWERLAAGMSPVGLDCLPVRSNVLPGASCHQHCGCRVAAAANTHVVVRAEELAISWPGMPRSAHAPCASVSHDRKLLDL